MMEKIDLYYPDFTKTGNIISRGDDIPDGRCAMVVFVCIFRKDGKMLIQKRNPAKSWGSYWDVSVGGAVQSGEDSLHAAIRETEEELGLKLSDFSGTEEHGPDRAKVFTKLLSVYYEKHIHDIYTAETELGIDSMTLQAEEVSEVKWADYAEICRMIDSGEFLPVHREFIALLFRMKTRPGIY